MNRRTFLHSMGSAALAGAAFTSVRRAGQAQNAARELTIPQLVDGSVMVQNTVQVPAPSDSGIDHIVVVTMENRSFDHFLGWLSGANGKQAGLTYLDKNGHSQSTYLLTDFENCGHPDPDHSYAGGRVEYDNGQMDGFLRAGSNDRFAVGYYEEGQLPFFTALAQNFMVCDRYFASILGPTFSNRMFLWAAQTDRLTDSIGLSNLPTIFDALQSAGVSHQYYFNNVPYLALWGLKYAGVTSLYSSFLTAAASGSLPAVSFVDPRFTVLDDGAGNDDHPHADVRNGDAFLAHVYQVLSQSPAWKNTVLIITFDEWGGFFEHVAPPRVAAANGVDTDQVNGQVLLGFRVPAVIVSPFTQNAGISPLITSALFDHTSILKLIEWRWGLNSLTPRDASTDIANPAAAMNFSSPAAAPPALPTPSSVFAWPCFEGGIFDVNRRTPATEWSALAASPLVQTWSQYPKFSATAEPRP